MRRVLALLALLSAPVWALESADSLAQQVIGFSNRARLQLGLRPLTLDPGLSQAAQQHVQEMERLHYFGHVSPVPEFATLAQRLREFGCYELSCAENLHRDQGYAPAHAGERAVQAWLASPQHRKNLLNPKYNRMGLGILRTGDQITFTQDLAYSAIDVLQQQFDGIHLSLHCQVNDGPSRGAVIYEGHRCANWSANPEGRFQVEIDLPAPGTVALGQSLGERDWLIETEWTVHR